MADATPGLTPGPHGVIVVHGIGEGQEKGEFLARVVNGLAEALEESHGVDEKGQAVYPVIRRQMDLTGDPAGATLDITAPDKSQSTWIFREAFWADAFYPPKASTVAGWMRRVGSRQLRYIFWGLWKDPVNNERFLTEGEREKEKYGYRAGLFLKVLYWVEVAAVGVALVPLSIAVRLLLLLLWPFYWIPRINLLNVFGIYDKALSLLHSLDPLLSKSIGDVQRYLEHGVWSASVRGVLEGVLLAMLRDEYGKVEDITIVAHSLGCTVTYDALAEGGPVAQEVKRLRRIGRGKKITFVGVGSAINQTFAMAEGSNLYAQLNFRKPLAKEVTGYGDPLQPQDPEALRSRFFWLDLYSRFDPVPAGDLDPWIEERAKISHDQIKRRRVINLDSPFLDHSHYWLNRELVFPRLARAINGGEKYPWAEAAITQKKVARRVRGVAWLALIRIASTALVATYVGLLLWHSGWRAEVVERVETAVIEAPALGSIYCQISNGAPHTESFRELKALAPSARKERLEQAPYKEMDISQDVQSCLLKGNPLRWDVGELFIVLFTGGAALLLGVGAYESTRATLFRDIS
ncbi:MAG: hypothetical protein HYU29_08500 [Chloroflexi bacterium]|nr:hypothetical protein [Chloroflexota bacterium]